MYVAYTRAKNLLGFVSEKEIKPSGIAQEPMDIINELSYIENKVCEITGKQPMERLENADLARFKLQNMTKFHKFADLGLVVRIAAADVTVCDDAADCTGVVAQVPCYSCNGGAFHFEIGDSAAFVLE